MFDHIKNIMSEDQLKAFMEAVNSDPSLQEKLKSAGDVKDVVGIAKGAGFAISVEDLQNSQSELSDAELESVAGGFFGKTEALCIIVRTVRDGVRTCIDECKQ